ncbi:sensor histidine kinase [Prosthecomicrobium pneumaticum]|uniref:histidine kinase n=1 Tax=Prosthecomicrobium pneumaticum TaxID=81895 RepID=A0A7W9FMG2_9HYPH|nr:HWE histidine kinase domain-containing protein [Prosthecomicrobium pneumaticum]MBB5753296.1 PAS domain S-box-containing protein [Prosthecomicrobium pneumaticum]
MGGLIEAVLGEGAFLPHGVCLLWSPALLTLHALSDALIAGAYFVIPLAILRFLTLRHDFAPSYRRVAYLFLAFIFLCGLTHLISLVTYWQPLYIIEGGVKALTAAVSVVTAILVWPILPKLLTLPSPQALEESNAHLKREIQAHVETLRQLNDSRADLERRVAQRTRELIETNQRFEAALASSDVAVFSQDRDLVFTWSYDPHGLWPAREVVGRTDGDTLPSLVSQEVVRAKRTVVEGGRGAAINIEVAAEDGASQYLRLSMDPLRDDAGEIAGLTSAVVDLTERHDYETRLSALTSSLAEANARFDLALRGSSISVFTQDERLRYTWVYNTPLAPDPSAIAGRTDAELMGEDRAAALIAAKRAVIEAAAPRTLDFELEIEGRPRSFEMRLEPIVALDGRVTGLAGVAVDITERRSHERHLRLVMRELTHRSKNLLAVIQAMARQTAARSDDPKTFVERFSARLRAMAASHDLLVAQEWHGAYLPDLVKAQLAQAVDPGSEQLVTEGPPVSLRPDAAQNIGLALHELTTNAAKYGALSVADGRIAIRWRLEGDRFVLRWEERGGPPVEPASRRGFGVTLLERTVGQALDGTVSVSFEDSGLVCEIVIPASHLLA